MRWVKARLGLHLFGRDCNRSRVFITTVER